MSVASKTVEACRQDAADRAEQDLVRKIAVLIDERDSAREACEQQRNQALGYSMQLDTVSAELHSARAEVAELRKRVEDVSKMASNNAEACIQAKIQAESDTKLAEEKASDMFVAAHEQMIRNNEMVDTIRALRARVESAEHDAAYWKKMHAYDCKCLLDQSNLLVELIDTLVHWHDKDGEVDKSWWDEARHAVKTHRSRYPQKVK